MDVVTVDVYEVALDVAEPVVRDAERLLSPDERTRYGRIAPHVRAHYIVTRAALRRILGERLDIDPRGVAFDYEPNGKPRLAPRLDDRLRFNLSHSADLALVAVGFDAAVGIDVEEMNASINPDELLDQVLSPRETLAYRRLPAALRRPAFFRAWTRKEAFVKATGEGLSRPLPSFEVTFRADDDARLLTVPEPGRSLPWSLVDLETRPEYAAALAVASSDVTVNRHR